MSIFYLSISIYICVPTYLSVISLPICKVFSKVQTEAMMVVKVYSHIQEADTG